MNSTLLLLLALLLAPLFSGLVLKIKAFFGGRKGSPVLINYYTLVKLLRKGSVYSTSTTYLFKLGPMVSLVVAVVILLFLPVAGQTAVFSFGGDIVLLLYLLGLGRFFTIAAAMDTASPFEGMGAAREAYFPIFCEAALFMILILFYLLTGGLSLADHFGANQPMVLWQTVGPTLLFVVASLFIVLLTENSRVPVDDPATHLELTMIHEVMILDHSGPDLAFIEWGASLKLFFYCTLITLLVCPYRFDQPVLDGFLFFGVLTLVYVVVGITESIMARFRMDKVPMFGLTSFALAFFAAVVSLQVMK
ncbi:MAG: hydrogenase [bacterium]|nr:hydrogenase [bacterium]